MSIESAMTVQLFFEIGAQVFILEFCIHSLFTGILSFERDVTGI